MSFDSQRIQTQERVYPRLGADNAETNETRYGKEHPLAKQHYTQANKFVHRCNDKISKGKRC